MRLLLTIDIPVGEHIKGSGLNIDTMWSTALAVAVVIALGLLLRRRVTAGVPGKVQLVWETIVGVIGEQVMQALGPKYRQVITFATAIFIIVLVSDWIEMLPAVYRSKDYLPSPSADVNFTYALGVTVWMVTNFAGIRAKGLGPWTKDFFAPLHFIEHITRPITLALRLFGNIFAGGIMIALLLSFPLYLAPFTVGLSTLWKLFDMFIGLIQAGIFALLTILYWQFSVEH